MGVKHLNNPKELDATTPPAQSESSIALTDTGDYSGGRSDGHQGQQIKGVETDRVAEEKSSRERSPTGAAKGQNIKG
ncbi:hypothetical protein TNCV_2071981 [Trichonephila clavipes]|nr:hypothetical protein TNCV_2071981 [Trichonephila clavipes]